MNKKSWKENNMLLNENDLSSHEYVFFDKGEYSNGWRYLEAFPQDIGGAPFGFFREDYSSPNLFVNKSTEYDKDNCTGTNIGDGEINTDLLFKAMGSEPYVMDRGGELCYFTAASICKRLNDRKGNKWFLPSLDELYLMYEAFKRGDLEGFSASRRYWSSSECERSPKFSYCLNFETGEADIEDRRISLKVRPIRAF